MAAEYVKVNGKASLAVKELLEVTGKKKIEDAFGEEVVLVVVGPIAGENKKPTVSSGKQVVVPVTAGDVLLLTKDEASEYLERVAKRRAEEYEKKTGQAPLDLEKARKEREATEQGQARGGRDSRDQD